MSRPLKAVFLQLVNRCNARCIICPYKDTYIHEPQQRMSGALYSKILDDLTPSYNGQIGLYLQHEPLLDSRLPQLITLAKKKCPESSVVIATNAHLLTPTLTRELVARPVDIIYLHISAGTPTTYEKIMYPLKWSRTIANAQRLIKQFKGKVVINFVKTLDNMGEVAWLRKIFPSVSIITRYWACNRGGRLDLPKMGKSRFHSCDELVNLPILQDGTILLCCNCWGRDVVLGNAYRDNILKVWQTNYMKPKYDICKDCW